MAVAMKICDDLVEDAKIGAAAAAERADGPTRQFRAPATGCGRRPCLVRSRGRHRLQGTRPLRAPVLGRRLGLLEDPFGLKWVVLQPTA